MINTIKTKAASAVLIALLILNTMCAFAYDGGDFSGEGTKESPYLIGSYEDYEKLAGLVNGGEKFDGVYFEQTADFEFPAVEYGTVKVYGINKDSEFAGIYNGAGHSVTCADNYNKISGYEPQNVGQIKTTGLFGNLTGTVLNLTASGYWRFSIDTGIFANCISGNGKLVNCGARDVTVCPELDGKGFYGLASTKDYSGTAMYNCFFAGNLFNTGITTSYPLTTVSGTTEYSYFYIANCRVENRLDLSAGESKNLDEMALMHRTLNENLEIVAAKSGIEVASLMMWKKDGSTPNLSGEYWHEIEPIVYEFEGSGTYEDPYLINTIDDYLRLAEYVKLVETMEGLYFVQTDDIEFAPALKEENELIVYGLGATDEFAGTYNGMGHSITLAKNYNYISSYDKWGKVRIDQGLFGKLSGTVMNVVVTGYWINNNDGGIIAYKVVGNGKIINCAATDFSSHAEMVGKAFYGFASTDGYEGTAIYNCYYSAIMYAAGNTKCYIITDNPNGFKDCYYCITTSRNNNNISFGVGEFVEASDMTSLHETLNDNLYDCAMESGVPAVDLLKWKARDKKPVLSPAVRGPLISDTSFTAIRMTGNEYTPANSDYTVKAVTYFKDAPDVKVKIDDRVVYEYTLSGVWENDITIDGNYIKEGKHTATLAAYENGEEKYVTSMNFTADGAVVSGIKKTGTIAANSSVTVSMNIFNCYTEPSDVTAILALYDKNGALIKFVPQKYASLDARKTQYNASVTLELTDSDLVNGFTAEDFAECSLYLYVWDNVKNMTALVNETQLQ